MKSLKIFLLIGLTFSLCCKSNYTLEIKCELIEEIDADIKKKFDASEVIIEGLSLKEEIYFNRLNSFVVVIVNAKTETLNFKSLTQDKYRRLNNYEEVEQKLKVEGMSVVNRISTECDLSSFDQVIITFAKRKKDGSLFKYFSNLYKIR